MGFFEWLFKSRKSSAAPRDGTAQREAARRARAESRQPLLALNTASEDAAIARSKLLIDLARASEPKSATADSTPDLKVAAVDSTSARIAETSRADASLPEDVPVAASRPHRLDKGSKRGTSTPPPRQGRAQGQTQADPNGKSSTLDLILQEAMDAIESTFVENDSYLTEDGESYRLSGETEAGARELFSNIAATYAVPVKDFILEVQRGTATKDWVEVCRPALRSIMHASRSMGMTSPVERMEGLHAALNNAMSSSAFVLGPATCRNILSHYARLVEIMPSTFTLDDDAKRGDGIIINSLLKQVSGVGSVTLEKIYAAGLTTLSTLLLANEKELSATTGIPPFLCERICLRLRQYKQESESTRHDAAKTPRRNRLRDLVEELSQIHDSLERTSDESTLLAREGLEEKRSLRTSRNNVLLQVNVTLAELGEPGLVKELERLPVARRIRVLEDYLEKAAAAESNGAEKTKP